VLGLSREVKKIVDYSLSLVLPDAIVEWLGKRFKGEVKPFLEQSVAAGVLRLCAVKFSQIAVALRVAGAAHWRILLVHPVWPAAVWWPVVRVVGL